MVKTQPTQWWMGRCADSWYPIPRMFESPVENLAMGPHQHLEICIIYFALPERCQKTWWMGFKHGTMGHMKGYTHVSNCFCRNCIRLAIIVGQHAFIAFRDDCDNVICVGTPWSNVIAQLRWKTDTAEWFSWTDDAVGCWSKALSAIVAGYILHYH